MGGHREKTAVYKPIREVLEENNPANTLILDLQPSELGENKFLRFKHPQSVMLCYSSPSKLIQGPIAVAIVVWML